MVCTWGSHCNSKRLQRLCCAEPPVVKRRVVKEEMVELDPALDFLPRSAEALFIQDVAAQVLVTAWWNLR